MHCSPSDKVSRFWEAAIWIVYLSTRRDLLVVRRGTPIPAVAALGNWRKSKKKRIVESQRGNQVSSSGAGVLHAETERRVS